MASEARSVRCRPATDADASAIRDLRHAWTEEDAGAPIVDDGFAAAFDAWWQDERARRRYWVAEVDGAVVGMVSVVTMTRMPRPNAHTPPWGYVHNLVVLPSHRGAGIGAELMAAAADACRADGYEHLLLHPRPRAVPFYERLGYRPPSDLLQLPL
jgi:GNAT superfamily N-acetyltransferase